MILAPLPQDREVALEYFNGQLAGYLTVRPTRCGGMQRMSPFGPTWFDLFDLLSYRTDRTGD